ncbi:hypothetical protein RS022_08450 [Candidatus Phytoplasma rubi]|uniref:Sequence-variable mosaic (SVM) signal sequence domain-containing protein n=1 Tax=Candidatus Phytoplasma rubi TaxID=399025 RepID=A0ABY7BTL7_9MOLU|nr:hypothetical protein [Candidatus Phytoplasma rubi]WAN63643.1 hypothetical protein RS022_08450 [Candidatus Phytoplasma rubi]
MFLNKNKFFFIILLYLIIIICIQSILASSYFHIRFGENISKSKINSSQCQIKLKNIDELIEEWMKNEPNMKIYDVNVQNLESIKIFLQNYKYINTQFYNHIPGYNCFGQINLNFICLKNPPKGLLGVYIFPRENPFKMKYSEQQYSLTLKELLENNTTIKKVYCFWNVKEINLIKNVNIVHIVKHDVADNKIADYINKYLDSKGIYRENRYIRKGCYNMSKQTGISIPLPKGQFNYTDVVNIYFDKGERFMLQEEGDIQTLLNMPNGAKNIYIFSIKNSTVSRKIIDLNICDN